MKLSLIKKFRKLDYNQSKYFSAKQQSNPKQYSKFTWALLRGFGSNAQNYDYYKGDKGAAPFKN